MPVVPHVRVNLKKNHKKQTNEKLIYVYIGIRFVLLDLSRSLVFSDAIKEFIKQIPARWRHFPKMTYFLLLKDD